jgi:hypothetical protein
MEWKQWYATHLKCMDRSCVAGWWALIKFLRVAFIGVANSFRCIVSNGFLNIPKPGVAVRR